MVQHQLRCLALFCLIAFLPTLSYGNIKCEDDESVVAAVTTADDGRLLDLALVVGNEIMRFPEANSTSVDLTAKRYKFAVKKKPSHDALTLDISGENGRMKFRGKTVNLECIWH